MSEAPPCGKNGASLRAVSLMLEAYMREDLEQHVHAGHKAVVMPMRCAEQIYAAVSDPDTAMCEMTQVVGALVGFAVGAIRRGDLHYDDVLNTLLELELRACPIEHDRALR